MDKKKKKEEDALDVIDVELINIDYEEYEADKISKNKRPSSKEKDDFGDDSIFEEETEFEKKEKKSKTKKEPEEEKHELSVKEATHGVVKFRGDDLFEERNNLVKKHSPSGTLIERLSREDINAEDAFTELIKELAESIEVLKGNELLFTSSGNLRDASVLTFKRVESIEKMLVAIQNKHKLIREETINLDSPYIRVLITYFFDKLDESCEKSGLDAESKNVLLNTFSVACQKWKKEVKTKILSMREKELIDPEGETEEKDE